MKAEEKMEEKMQEKMEEQEAYWHWFCASLFSDPGLERKLLEHFGTPQHVFRAGEEEIKNVSPKNERKLSALCAGRKKWDFGREADRLDRLDIRFVSREHPDYPARLRELQDAPCGLFFRGALPADDKPSVAIVGARNCSAYGNHVSYWFAKELARQGVQIVSGMARGIDGISHRGALAADGRTFAVLAGGVDRCYPEENRDIYMELEQRGGLISESPPGVRPLTYLFPLRNRILSGLSDAVLIIEAKEKSGSLITADCALEQGREVYAVPGPLGEALSAGCHNLIRQGAGLAVSPEKLLEDLMILPGINMKKMQKNKITLERSENLVYSCLRLQAQNLGEICEKTGLAPESALGILAKLQLKGYAKEVSRNYYIRGG